MTDDWDERVARFWVEFDDGDPDAALAGMHALVGERPDGDARALYERGSVHDSLGQEQEAIPLYRAALAAGLDEEHEPQAVIQLASSLRNVGDVEEAVALLQTAGLTAWTGDAARAFLALALRDAGRPDEALQVALLALAPTLPRYTRAVRAYADDLTRA
ncbi:tetratricopeptide repeat protein [Amnibacterium kyonggiense]|uniref:Tetratricopeptide repeat protein n=1 Tax=Amnibacterium kyonggiense TaxID=595671 RepID=A0A4V3EA88_9MICO|nr:tetratricopeptide repeat protein [Amnibacterium kyonggiense]TDS75074.1 tetratricopeptide repeat protein [Amnibacterium kyonggiense]